MLTEIGLKNFQVGPVGPGQRLGLHMHKQDDVIAVDEALLIHFLQKMEKLVFI